MLEELLCETKVPEREHFDMSTANALDRLLSRMAAVQRYRVVRKYCRGHVVDAASGCGYGSWILSKCPDVSKVTGFEVDEESVIYARKNYPGPSFNSADLCSYSFGVYLQAVKPDTIVSLETVEHLPDARMFLNAVKESGASRFVVTFPSFETVRFNPYHLRDFTPTEMDDLMGVHAVKHLTLDDAVHVLVYDL